MTITLSTPITISTTNWPDKVLGLLLATLLFLVLSSCEEDTSIVRDEDFALANLDVSYTEIPTTGGLFRDSVRTTNVTYLQAGHVSDPLFGEITAEAYTQVRIEAADTVESGALADSVQMFLFMSDFNYPATGSSVETIQVFQLDEKLEAFDDAVDSSRIFYTSLEPRTATRMLGSNFIEVSESFSPVRQLLEIELDPLFGQEIVDNWIASEGGNYNDFLDQEQFQEEIKGLALKGLPTNKAIFTFASNPSPTRSVMILYYHNPGETFARRLSFNFLNVTSSRNDFMVQYNYVDADRSGTDIPVDLPFNQYVASPTNDLYVQASTGLNAAVDLSSFYNYFDSLDQLIQFVRADIEFNNVEVPADDRRVLPISIRYQYFNKTSATDSSRTSVLDLLTSSQGTPSVASSIFQKNDLTDVGKYSFDLYSFLRTQLDRPAELRASHLIIPANPRDISVRRVVLNNTSIKFRIYYTSIN